MQGDLQFGLTTGDGRRPRVAVVGGTPATAMITILLVEQFGGAPLQAATGEAALALLRGEKAVDLVVIDLALADMDGNVAAQLIRTLGRRGAMPILALAANPGDTATPRGRAAGFAATVLKPYSPRELYGAMQSALDHVGAVAVSRDN
jgi:CheY-like chemotaxis protein